MKHGGSLPLRECGLKFMTQHHHIRMYYVTPLAGVWIEISKLETLTIYGFVTPLAGVWIEIHNLGFEWQHSQGHSPCGSVD